MTDWKLIAVALDPPIPQPDLEKIVPVLDALERAFRPLVATLPHGADVWTVPPSPEDRK